MLSAKRFRNESGYMIVILPLVLLLLTVAVCTARASWDAASADVLKGATALAVKAAANQYDEGVKIDFSSAHQVFKEILGKNLELKKNLKPQKYSAFADRPEYDLLIYNGSGTESQPPGIKYTFKNGTLTETEIAETGFPQSFFLTDGTEVKLKSPGVIAEVRINSKKLFGKAGSYRRWAAARIAQVGRSRKVILEGRQR